MQAAMKVSKSIFFFSNSSESSFRLVGFRKEFEITE